MREIQNDLLFNYCLIYLLNGLIDVPGSHRQQRLFFFKVVLKEIDCKQKFH